MPDRTDREDRASQIEKEIFLRTLQIGRFGTVAQTMAARMRNAFFAAGTPLYREGEAAQNIFFIKHGEVVLQKQGQEPWVFRDRDVVGTLDALQDRAHDRTALAIADTTALSVTVEDWFELFEDNYEITRQVVTGVARNLWELGLKLPPTAGFPPPVPDDTEERPIRTLDTVERIITLREAPLLAKANVQPLTALASLVENRRLEAGEVLFRQAEPASAFFLVVRGLVEIAREDPIVRAGFGPGEVVGGYGAVAHAEQPFEAVARIPTLLFRVSFEDYFDLMEDHFELARSLLAEMARAREHIMRRIADRELLSSPRLSSQGLSLPGDGVIPSAG